jgi:hypothetical protein
MGAAENRAKSSAQAAYMKERGIMRRTGACPWHCGAMIPIGGQALMAHLNQCRGGGAKRKVS